VFEQPINTFHFAFPSKMDKTTQEKQPSDFDPNRVEVKPEKTQETMPVVSIPSISYILGLPSVQNKQEPEKEPKWTDESKLEDILKVIYQEKKLDEFFESHCDILLKNGLKYLEQWKDLTEEDKDNICMKPVDPIPIPLRKLLDKVQGTFPKFSFYRYCIKEKKRRGIESRKIQKINKLETKSQRFTSEYNS
jgi:hypothetical protein